MVFHAYYLIHGIGCILFDAWYLMHGIWCMVFDVWYLIHARSESCGIHYRAAATFCVFQNWLKVYCEHFYFLQSIETKMEGSL